MVRAKMRVPVCEPSLGERELANAQDAILSGWISGYKGKYIDEFERRFAAYCDARYGIVTTSCATAMLLTLESLGIGKGDEVITTDFTMIATLSAIIHAKARPVVVDVEPDTWCIDPELIEAKVTPRTKAIMPVPIYGHPTDMTRILEIAGKHGLLVIEDAAEAIGSEQDGYRSGARGDAACFSFYINKTISTGEGGIVLTNDEELAKTTRRLKGYDTDPENRFIHERLGFNYRMTNVQAAIGCAQLDQIEEFVSKKKHIAARCLERLGKVEGLTMPAKRPDCKNSYWVFGILVDPRIGRDRLMGELAEQGIETRRFFAPMHSQPALSRFGLDRGQYPVTDYISQTGLYLPNGTPLTDDQVDYVCDRVKGSVEEILRSSQCQR